MTQIEDPSSPEDIKKLIVVMRENMVTKYPRVQEVWCAVPQPCERFPLVASELWWGRG